jgi:hypothetical protein
MEGKLKGSFKDLRKDPSEDQCEVCLRGEIERYAKTGEATLLRRGAERIELDVGLAGPLNTSVDGYM